MSKTVKNSHRRQMRTVTPAVRAGRMATGAALAAGMMFTGGSVATAETGTSEAAGQNEVASPVVLAPATAPAVALPDAAAGKSKKKAEPSLAPAAGTISVSLPEPEPEPEVVEEETTEVAQDDAAAAQEQAPAAPEQRSTEQRADRSAERSSQQQDDSSQQQGQQEQQEQQPAPEEEKPAQQDNGISPGKGESILATARSGIGVPYVYGGSSTSGWDCSGFVRWVYAQHGINLPHGASAQIAQGRWVPRSEARPGDLVYKPGHVGIYAGGNMFVDAGNARVGTSERQIYSGNWSFYRIVG